MGIVIIVLFVIGILLALNSPTNKKPEDSANPSELRRKGTCFLYGINCTPNINAGIRYLQMAAEKGDTIAMELLGQEYMDGDIISKDLDKAEYWFRKAVPNTNGDAYMHLARTLWQKNNAFEMANYLLYHPEDQSLRVRFSSDWGKEAFSLFSSAIKCLGNSNFHEAYFACYYYGICNALGLGCNKYLDLGREYLEKSIEIACKLDGTWRIEGSQSALNCLDSHKHYNNNKILSITE